MIDEEIRAIKAVTNTESKSLVDSIGAKWLRSIMQLLVIPIMLAGVYHIWDKVEEHGQSFVQVNGKIDVLTNKIDNVIANQSETKNAISLMAQSLNTDERNIAGLQQEDIDRHQEAVSPPVVTTPPANDRWSPPAPQRQHHTFNKPPDPPLLAAIEHLLHPAHGIRARMSAHVEGR